MAPNYQIIVDSIANMLLIGFPIILVMDICQRLISIFESFVLGRRVNL